MKKIFKWAGLIYVITIITAKIWFPDREEDFILDSKQILKPEAKFRMDSTMLHPQDTTKFKTEWIEVDK